MNIKTELRDITPDWAGETLDKHYKRIADGKFTQRPISMAVVYKYASEMSNGAWKTTPESISFDVNGDLLNGQQRLEAVRMSKRTVRMTVSTGWPIEDNGVGLIDVLDTGRPRTIGQMLHLHGQAYAGNYAATARSIARIGWAGARPIMTYSTTVYVLDKIGARWWIERILSKSESSRDFQARLIGPLAYYFSSKPNKAMEFADGVFNFKTESSKVVQAFLRWQKNNEGSQTETYNKAIASALRTFDANEEIQLIKPTIESVEWLSNTNPKLREQLRKLVPRAQPRRTK